MILTVANPEPCISFIAIADKIGLEGQEVVTVNLSAPPNIILQKCSLTVNIEDRDGMYEASILGTLLGLF